MNPAITGLLRPLVPVVCDTCGSDNSNSWFANYEGETCREFACFGTMKLAAEPEIDFQI